MAHQPLVAVGKIRLKHFDPAYDAGLDKDRTKDLTDKYRRRIDELQQLLYANSRQALLLVFQGMDASGKDGAVRSILHEANPMGIQVTNFKQPSAEELAHDYLWRVHHAVPRYGWIGVFNRSHYESVLVERVASLVPRQEWSRRYEQIVNWERMLAENRVVILKFFLHISRHEQGERFKERLENPKKHWKFSKADLTTRKHWNAYMDAYEDLLNTTSHPAARWHIVPANRNWYRDYVVAKTVVEALDNLKLKWPR